MASDVVPSTSASVIIDTSTVSTGSNSPFRGLTSHGSQKSVKSHSSIQIHGHSLDVDQPECMYLEPTRALHPRARSMGETFLLCVFIQKDQYVLLRTALYNNAQDVIKQVSLGQVDKKKSISQEKCFSLLRNYNLNILEFKTLLDARKLGKCFFIIFFAKIQNIH